MEYEITKKTKISCLVRCNSRPPELPVDFWFQVFERLPIKQLFRCMFVSKFWCSIIRQPTFIQAYCSRNPFSLLCSITQINRNPMGNVYEVSLSRSLYCSNIVPSCQQEFFNFFDFSMFNAKRGVLYSIPIVAGVTEVINGFFCAYIGNSVLLVNVFTGQATDLLCPHIPPNAVASYFFGFEPITGLYKLLCIDYSNYDGKRLETNNFQDFYILSISGSDQEFSWRRLRLPEESRGSFNLVCRSISVNGALHWIHEHEDSISVSCFDLTREEFVYLDDANVRWILRGVKDIRRRPCLVEFKGKVSLFYCKGKNMIIRSRETDNSWTVHEATLPDEFQNPALIRVGRLSTGKILLAYPEVENSITQFYVYDNKFERLVVGKFPQSVNLALLNPLYVEQNIGMLEALLRRFSPSS